MDAAVRYCTAPDGVRIAYTVVGDGRPLVMLVPIPGSIEMEMELPVARAFYERLVPGHTVVRFDLRGTGASQRDVSDFSIQARANDVGGLVDHLGFSEFDMFAGPGTETHTALLYVSGHAGRVRRLVLWEPITVWRPRSGPVADAQRVLILHDWRGAAGAFGYDFTHGWPEADKRTMRRLYRETLTAENFFALGDFVSDVSGILPRVSVPTLVLHARKDQQFSLDESRVVAAQMPDARHVTIEADHAYFFSWHEQIVPRMREFLGDAPVSSPVPVETLSPFRTVLFTDLVGHTEMMQRLGDEKGRDVLREHERITRETLKQHGGSEIKTDGDSFMVSFASVASAVECAIALQRAFAAREGEPLNVRMGLNAGEPIEEDGDLFGATVILASRVAAQADSGEILIPEPVRHLLAGKGFVFADRGETMLKGFEDAVRLFEVRWRE